MKTCTRCATRKADDQFHTILVNGKAYLHSYCKLCQRLLARERYRRINNVTPTIASPIRPVNMPPCQ